MAVANKAIKVLVLGGGDSPEKEVSLRSAAAVVAASNDAGYNTEFLDPSIGMERLVSAIKAADVILPIMHGEQGEDGWIQRIIEAEGKPFLGASSVVSEVTIDKVKTKKVLAQNNGFAMARSIVVGASNYAKECQSFVYRYVLKPIAGGSSIDTLIVRDESQFLAKNADDYFGRHIEMMLEELIDGVELTVPILGDKALEVIEIIPPMGAEFDYTNKYNGKTLELCPPQNIPIHVQDLAKSAALCAHNTLGVRHISRVDMIWSRDKGLYFLEINTMPGMTVTSLFPKSANVAGMNMQALVTRLITLVVDTN
jgi:D-alanine--D-alanine ligase